MKIYVLILSLFIILPAVSQEEKPVDEGWNNQKMPYAQQNTQVPRKLWEVIKEILKSDGVDKKSLENFVISPTAVRVELSADENPQVLKESMNHRLLFTEGGGDLDLFDFVEGKGAFFMRFGPHLLDGNKYHILYVSDSPGKKVDNDQWGNGCGNLFDITDKSSVFLLDQGIRLNTSKKHYLHLTAGLFVFFQLVEDKLYLGYIRVKDSRYPQFTCKNT